MEQANFKKLISGQSSGLTATILRLLLYAASEVYSTIIRIRNHLYSKGWLKTHRTNAAVISIGNITTGGTGKTPLVVWLCNQLTKNYKVAILTRGYKSSAQESQNYRDEPAILAESCPQAKVIVNPDRVAGAAEAINKFGANVLIMDDGFQHRRLGRDLDIIAIDATVPFGYDKMLPAGLLREPINSLKRADAAVITRCDQVTETELGQIEKNLGIINPDMLIAKSIHTPAYIKSENNKEIGLEQIKGKEIFAFCGIGNPEAFLNTIRQLGGKLLGSKVFNDHYHYTDNCLSDIYKRAEFLKVDLILTTQKDWTKIISDLGFRISDSESSISLAYIGIEIEFLAGEDKLRDLIENALEGKIFRK
ncbi:MAG: tetraacyldisaccharide 4'-kinase [Phycisphaerales bacterium]|jgi:tetraacyldisaccharide 4'-kinase